MSLSEAIIQIADQMQEQINQWVEIDYIDGLQKAHLYSYINQLRIAVKSQDRPPISTTSTLDWRTGISQNKPFVSMSTKDFTQKLDEDPKSTDVFLDKVVKNNLEKEEVNTPKMVEALDDSGILTYVPIDQAMPVGARTFVGGNIYQLKEDGKLYFDEVSTNIHKNSKVSV